jgi:hypothetical protein
MAPTHSRYLPSTSLMLPFYRAGGTQSRAVGI